jgi:hypothetical protein
MKTEANEHNHQTRAYFLEQGKSIGRLYDILNSNLFVHHLRKWSALLAEISLYILFFTAFAFIFFYPLVLEAQLGENPTVQVRLIIDEFEAAISLFRLVLAILATPVLLFAILLGRNRKKNNLIRQAFNETKKMKEGFDMAVKELKF